MNLGKSNTTHNIPKYAYPHRDYGNLESIKVRVSNIPEELKIVFKTWNGSVIDLKYFFIIMFILNLYINYL